MADNQTTQRLWAKQRLVKEIENITDPEKNGRHIRPTTRRPCHG